MTKKELLEMLKDPEVTKALEKNSDNELEELLSGLDISDDDTLESISKKHQQQLGKVVAYFNNKLSEVEKSAVAKAQQPQIEKAEAEIREFSKANPGMSNPEVVALMQPLYDKGKPLAECYKRACKALDLDPVTGKAPEEEEEAKSKKNAPKSKEKETPKSSAKSSVSEDPSGDEEEDKPDMTGKSLEEIISANMNNYEAKTGKTIE